jgi:hypothetical protein
MVFPPRAVRDIRVRYVTPSCQGGTAIVTVDFEPLLGGTPGFVFVDAVDWSKSADDLVTPEELRYCADKFAEGILLTLAGADGPAAGSPGMIGPYRSTFPLGEAVPGTFAHALAEGFPLRGQENGPLISVRAVLRESRHHVIDSVPFTYRRAGRRAAHKAMSRIYGTPLESDPADRA